jgi:hypothetical protein
MGIWRPNLNSKSRRQSKRPKIDMAPNQKKLDKKMTTKVGMSEMLIANAKTNAGSGIKTEFVSKESK